MFAPCRGTPPLRTDEHVGGLAHRGPWKLGVNSLVSFRTAQWGGRLSGIDCSGGRSGPVRCLRRRRIDREPLHAGYGGRWDGHGRERAAGRHPGRRKGPPTPTDPRGAAGNNHAGLLRPRDASHHYVTLLSGWLGRMAQRGRAADRAAARRSSISGQTLKVTSPACWESTTRQRRLAGLAILVPGARLQRYTRIPRPTSLPWPKGACGGNFPAGAPPSPRS